MTGISCGLIAGYTAELAAFAGEKKLDKLSETVDSAGDLLVFKYDPLARYPAKGVAVYSVVELNRGAVAHRAVTIYDFPHLIGSLATPGASQHTYRYVMTS